MYSNSQEFNAIIILKAYYIIIYFILSQLSYLNASKYLEFNKSNQMNFDFEKNLENWCKYVKTTPEPHLLIYNKIGKCGSSSFRDTFAESVKLNKNLSLISTDSSLWKQLSSPNPLINPLSLLLNVSRDLPSHKMVIIEGHWHWINWHNFISGNNRNINIEYFQLLRSCQSRLKSYFYYMYDGYVDMHDEILNRLKEKDLKSFRLLLFSNRTIYDCIQDYNCLLTSKVTEYFRNVTFGKYMSGYDGYNQYRSHYNGALHRLYTVNNTSYQLVGILEKMHTTFQLLECLYPNYFYRLSRSFRHSNRRVHAHVYNDTNSNFTAWRNTLCEENGDNEIYQRAIELLEAKLAYSKKCCRKRYH